MKKNLTLLLLCCAYVLSAQTFVSTATMMPWGATWKWKNNSTDLGTAWYDSNYNDAAFSSGSAPLGYGAVDAGYFGLVIPAQAVVTSIGSSGATGGTNTATFYFRSTFTLSTSSYSVVQFKLRVDDGCAIYLNGQMVSTAMTKYATASMTNSTVSTSTVSLPFQLTTPASYTSMTNAQTTDGQDLFTFTLSVTNTLLVNGTNTIAVEVHNRSNDSSDILWAMQVEGGSIGTAPPAVPAIVKGPYLQVGTQSSMIIRWESDIATDTKVMYGTNPASLTFVVSNTASVISHFVQLTGLSAYTKYYYSIGTSTYTMQGDANNYFLTSPVPGTPGKYRFWMVGDCGNASTNQVNCMNQYLAYTGTTVTNGMLLSGDNAYTNGTNAEYNSEFFGIYQGSALKKMPMWSAPGNHDYDNGAQTGTTVPYFTYFTTPANGEAGGVPSNNPAYYSFDYGNIHFLSLDSYGTTGASQKMYDTTGAQVNWIKQDLASNTKKWTIAYWHHPPYTMGSHNSDNESDLAAIRLKFIRILERNKVDMIICGHSHDYERSKLMNGHYGNEASFNAATHNLSSSSGKYDGTSGSCPYTKDSVVNKVGTVYVLSGSAGQLGGQQSSFPHDAMYYSNATNGGTFILDIEDNKLEGKWLCADGVVRDNFTMFKDVKSQKNYTVQPGQTTTLTASWPGIYSWINASTARTVTASAVSDTTIWVKDPNSCVADTFKLKVLPSVSFTTPALPFCTSNAIPFNDLSTNLTNTWSWSVTPSAGASISNNTAKNPTITFTASGTYTVSLAAGNINGMGTVFSRTVSVVTASNVQVASTSSAVCFSQSLSLTASGVNTYSWSNGASTASIIVTPTATSVYSITGIDLNGCQSTVVKTVTVNSLPVITVTSTPANLAVCAGNTLILNAGGAMLYSWNGGITNGTAFTPTATANYTVNATDNNGCQNTAVKSVTVNALPVLTITATPANAVVCNGATLSVNASGANSYAWTNGITNGASFTPLATTIYTVTGTDNNGCQNTAIQSVTVNALPVVTVTSNPANAVVCNGSTLNLTATGASTYAWTSGLTNGTSFTPSATAVYTVTATDNNGCQNTAVKSVTVNALPVLTITANPANAIVCSGATLSMNAAGANTYAWSNGISNGISFTPTASAVYSVNATDNNGCTSSMTKSVTVNTTPTLSTTATASAICIGQSATFTASGAATYLWNTSSAVSTIVVTPTTTSVYTYTGTALNNCQSIGSKTVIVNPLPVVTIVSNPTTAVLCSGSTLSLNGTGATSYAWTGGITNGTAIIITANASFTVTGTNANGCQNTAVKTISVNPLPVVTISGNSTVCAGQTTTLTAAGALSYDWSNGASGAVFIIVPSTSYNYLVTGTDANGCKNHAGTNFVVHELPEVISETSNPEICAGQSATLSANGASTYNWNNNATGASIVVSPGVTTTYTVTGSDANGCSNRSTVTQNVSECTSLKTVSSPENSITVYPNPNSGTFHIDVNRNGNMNIEIFNTLGAKVYSGKLETGNNNLMLETKHSIYFYTITDDKNIISSGKLIVE